MGYATNVARYITSLFGSNHSNQSSKHTKSVETVPHHSRKRTATYKGEIFSSNKGDAKGTTDDHEPKMIKKKVTRSSPDETSRKQSMRVLPENDSHAQQSSNPKTQTNSALERPENGKHCIKLKNKLEHRDSVDMSAFRNYNLKYIKFLGAGGQGEVHQVYDSIRQVHYALKIIKQNSAAKKYEKDALEAIQRHKYQGIIILETSIEDDDFLLLLTQYVDGLTVRDIVPYMEQFPMEKRLEFATPLLAELCLAVDFLHSQDYVHRDIKASNCFLDMNGHLTIGDFGSCIQNGLIRPRVIFGTVPYTISPEMFAKVPYGEEADFWGIGVLACELLLGFFPFEWFTREDIKSKETVNDVIATIKNPQIPEEIPSELYSLLRGLLHEDPKLRLGSAAIGGITSIEKHRFFAGINWTRFRDPNFRNKPLPVLKLMKAIQKKRAAKQAVAQNRGEMGDIETQ